MSVKRPLLRPEESGVVQALAERDLTLADALGKYRLLGALGSGGMADVYLAVADGPEGFRKLCVLKLLKEQMAQDDDFRAMFLDEARLAARLNHPNIVQTFEVGETHGRLMIAMEYVEGQPANRVRRRLAPEQFPLTAYISVLCDVLDALEYAHGLADFDGSTLGIVHRDVSPHNIIVGYDGRVKLVDFGIAKSAAAMQETQAGVLKGKVGYMAPEQASMRDVDGRTDVFSVGVILWEAIAGRRLVEGMSSHEVLMRRVEGNDPPIASVVPSVDPQLAAICDRAMAREPDDRFGSAAELQVDLELWLKQHGEPNRKDLSRAVREAFVVEREQLRSLVEQRMGDTASLSGMRASLSLPAPAFRPAPPPASQSAPPPADPSMTPHRPPPPSTLSVAPPARRSGVGLVILGVAASVVFGVAGTIYVVRQSPTSRPGDVPSSEVAPQPFPPDSAKVAAASEPASAAEPRVAVPGTPLVTAMRPGRPPFVAPVAPAPPVGRGPTNNGRAPVVAASAASAPVNPAPLVPVTPPKTPTRPLDEKDPYAP